MPFGAFPNGGDTPGGNSVLIPYSGLLVNSDTPGDVSTFAANEGWETITKTGNQVDPIGFAIPASRITRLDAVAPTGTSTIFTFTLFKNGNPTALTCTIDDGTAYAQGVDNNPAHAVDFVDGDRFDIQVTATAPFESSGAFSGSISGTKT